MLLEFNEMRWLFASRGIELDEKIYGMLKKYAEILVETNKKFNLTAITDPRGIAEKHFLDSVLPLTMVDIPQGASLCDVGSGAGFPGVPMKIFRPDISLTLLDSLNKRVNFLRELTAELGLEAACIHARAEDMGRGELRARFDFVTARAVSRLERLAGWCLPLLRPGGVLLALKGGDCAEEIAAAENALKRYGGRVVFAKKYTLPNGDGRTVVGVERG